MNTNLKIKTVIELRAILKNQNLPVSGKKEDLINRILENKPKIQKVYETFLDLLPGDVVGILDKFRLDNEPNNKALIAILSDGKILFNYQQKISYFNKGKNKITKFFVANELDIKIAIVDQKRGFKIGKLPIISNSLLQKLIFLLIESTGSSFECTNVVLRDYKCNFRIVSYWTNCRSFEIVNCLTDS